MKRPDYIKHWHVLEGPDNAGYPGSDEKFAISTPVARHVGLRRLGVSHIRLPPGRRTSYPYAQSSDELYIYVLEGYPQVWVNGSLHELSPGDSVGFVPGTGLCHTFLNNTTEDVRFLVVEEPPHPDNRTYFPLNPGYAATRHDRWIDHPPQFFGAHDGKPDQLKKPRR